MNPEQLPSLDSGLIPAPTKRALIKRAWIVVLAVVLVAAGAGAVWLQAQRSGGPPIAWTQADVLEFLVPNEDRTVTVTFRSNQNLLNVVAEATPSLRSALSVVPANLGPVTANRDYQVTMRLGALVPAGTKLEGTLQLKDAVGSPNTYAVPLPITIVVHSEPVPPDPGEAGKQTLEGIDSNGDGVRDDVERWVVLTQLNDESLRQALLQLAGVEQAFLVSRLERAPLRSIDDQRIRAHDCLESFAGAAVARGLVLDLKAEVLNTKERSLAYVEALKIQGAKPFLLTDESALRQGCDF